MISVGKQGSFVDENMCETNLRCYTFSHKLCILQAMLIVSA